MKGGRKEQMKGGREKGTSEGGREKGSNEEREGERNK